MGQDERLPDMIFRIALWIVLLGMLAACSKDHRDFLWCRAMDQTKHRCT